MARADLVVVGGGIVGLATAWRFGQRRPGASVVVLEKEARLAAHQTGRNSGVIHSGIYYKPGSLKAANCRRGKAMLEEFCREHGVPFEICGKVIVATDRAELPRLDAILERGRANGVACERIGSERLRELEPHSAGIAALHVPEAGIVDYTVVVEKLAGLVRSAGGEVVLGARVRGIREQAEEVVVEHTGGEARATRLVNCAGLHSDRVVELAGMQRPARIVPFRGEYYELTGDAPGLVRNLIYPVPDPSFPFLGVHFTRMIGGGVECGPNAVLALAREGYDWRTLDVSDLLDTLGYPAFHRLALRHWRMGLGEMWRSASKAAFCRALQRLVPSIRGEDLVPAPAGVRAQALLPDGALCDDFLVERRGRQVHVCNAPSPAATASLSIGEHVVDALLDAPNGEGAK